MNEQIIILFFIIIFTCTFVFLRVWKAKKEIEYKGDERWVVIQNKANQIAYFAHYILIVALAIASTIMIFSDSPKNVSYNRAVIYGILFIGLYNVLELCGLLYYNKHL